MKGFMMLVVIGLSCVIKMATCIEGQQLFTFSMPPLTEEEQHSIHMPDYFKCDGCKAIAFQFAEAFKKAESKYAVHRKLTESEIYELTEDLCDNGFEMYGLKSVAGTKQLSGPGLEADNVPGMAQMGGKWPNRLRSLCAAFLDEIGDEHIYEAYLQSADALNALLCMGKGTKQYCSSQSEGGKSTKNDEL